MSSIYGYDIVLSLKETTIQNQFQVLYDSSTGNQVLPSLDDAGNPVSKVPTQQYLLNHHLYASTAKGNSKGTVIDAHIKCPTIQLGAGSGQQAGLKFFFCADESSAQSSVLKYWIGNKHNSVVLDGWSMSWICDITTKKIENVIEQLIEPSKKTSDPVVLDPTVQKSLEDIAKSPKNYLISSLFCALESQQLASSFEVHDNNGNAADPTLYAAFKAIMIQRVDDIASATTPGIPTADNPFILGYGIVQNATNANGDQNPTPDSFVPQNFSLLISPASGSQPACLNYLMQTQHDAQDVAAANVDPDGLVKYLQSSLAVNDAFSGSMILSRLLTCQHLMGEMLGQKFFDALDPSTIINLDLLKYGKTTDDHIENPPPSVGLSTSLNKVWSATGHFAHSFKRHLNSFWFDIETDHGSQSVLGDRCVTATLSNEAQPGNADGLQRLLMTFDISLMYKYETDYKATIQDHNEGTVSIKYRVTYTVNTGEDGRWVFEIDQSRSVVPQISNGKVDMKNEEANDRLGAFVWGSHWNQSPGMGMDPMPISFASDLVTALPDLQTLTDAQLTSLTSAINDAMPALNKLVLMPAGDVYTFNGLESTEEGFVTSRIKYKSRTSGEIVEKSP